MAHIVISFTNKVIMYFTLIITFPPPVVCDIYAECIHVCNNKYPRVVFLFSKPSIPALEIAERPSQSVLRLPYFDVRWSGSKADHSHPSHAEIKANELYINSICLQGMHKDNFVYIYICSFIYGCYHYF
jgi:hypothetical protein